MITNIITIGDAPHAKWGVSSDTFKVAGKTRFSYFLESEDQKILQKVKLGGSTKYHDLDGEFNGRNYGTEIGEVQEYDFFGLQTINLPFTAVGINPKNLNPYLAGINQEDMYNDRMVVLLVENSYAYVRSSINREIAEIVCTFHTNNMVGCIIRIDNNKLKELDIPEGETPNLIMLDTSCGEENFVHFHININGDEMDVVKSTIKKPELIKKLSVIDAKFNDKKLVRRFVRTNEKAITTFFVHPSSINSEELLNIVNRHGISDSLARSEVSCTFYPVNVDENGVIINDKDFKDIMEEMKEDKVKAFTLINCRITKNLFEEIKPLYIFSFDSTEDVTNANDIKPIICVKSN